MSSIRLPAVLVALVFAACGPADTRSGEDAGDGVVDAGPAAPPTLTSIDPPQAVAGDAYTITGTGFQEGIRVFFGAAEATGFTRTGSTTITGQVPTRIAEDPLTVPIVVRNPDGLQARLQDAFVFADTGPKVQSCTLMAPTTQDVKVGDSVKLAARAFHPGVTDQAGAGAGLRGQWLRVEGSEPSAWAPTAAAWERDEGSDDVFSASLTAEVTLRYAFRFSLDGVQWTYCDADGSANGVDAAQAGQVNVGVKLTLLSIAPTTARAGTEVLITGTGFASTTTFSFGANAATDVTSITANEGRVKVPAGSGTVDVIARGAGGETVKLTQAFTYEVDPDAVVVSRFSPEFLTLAGGDVVITGANFGSVTAVNWGSQVLTPADVTATSLRVTFPKQGPGANRFHLVAGARSGDSPTEFALVPRLTAVPDGSLTEWPAEAQLAHDETASDWTDQNQLRTLFAGYDDAGIYLGVQGRAEASNAIVGYLSFSSETWGTADLKTLTDETGTAGDAALDGVVSSKLKVTAAGFKAQFAFGSFGRAPVLVADVAPGMGLRRLDPPGDFGWLRSTVKRCDAAAGNDCGSHATDAVEFFLPWKPAGATGAADNFLAKPPPGTRISLFVRVLGASGTVAPNQALPSDPKQALGATDRLEITRVASFPVY